MSNDHTAAYHSPQVTQRIFASGAVGNILETYDLILISLMATTLSSEFFPPAAMPYAHVIDVLYVFLIGLLIRPIGNVIMSVFSDQLGRKKLMTISLVFTGLGTALIGLLPNYSLIGVWSTVIFILLRIFQNFFAGIEYINSATYLIENSKQKTLGYYGSWTALGISGGYLLASIVALIVSTLISNGLIPGWCWRLIFLFSIAGIWFGFWIRRSIPESLTFILNNANSQPQRKSGILMDSLNYILNNSAQSLSIAALTLLGICLSFIYYIYIPINLITTRGFSQSGVFSLNIMCLSFVVMLIPIFGILSDHYNRIAMLKITSFLILLLAMPFFWLTAYGTYWEILFSCILISIPSACFFSLYPVIVTESFPTRIRCTTASLIYQVIVSFEMGTLPLLVNYLLKQTSIPYSPGYLLMVSAVVGFFGLYFLKKLEIKGENRISSDFVLKQI